MELAAKKRWISASQLAGTLIGALIVVFLRLRGIRFLGYVPTLVFVWVPIVVGSGIQLVVTGGTRRTWILWTLGLVIFVALTVYLGIGETPSALLPPPNR